MTDTFPCPQCGVLLRRSPALAPGALVKCPRCTHQFRVPEQDAPALPSLELDDLPEPPIRPETPPPFRADTPFAFEDSAGAPPPPPRSAPRDRGEAGADRPRPDLSFEDDEEDDRPHRRRDRDWEDEDRPRRRGRVDGLPTGIPVDLGGSYRLAWSCWGEFVGPAVGYGLLLGLALAGLSLVAAIPILGHLAYSMIAIPLIRGPQIVALSAVQGKRWVFGDFFTGFNYFGPFIGLAFFQGMLALIAGLPALFVAILVRVMFVGGPRAPNDLIGGSGVLAAGLLGLAIFLYLDARLFTFAAQLIIHRRFGVIEAMRGCWRLSEGSTLTFVAVNLLSALTALSGLGGFCIGYLLTVPLAHLFVASAYARTMNLRTAEDSRSERSRPWNDEEDEEDRPRPRRPARPDDY